MAKGQTGGSMGGQTVRVKPNRPQFNTEMCHICMGLKDGPCIKQAWENAGQGTRLETHKNTATNLGLEWPVSLDVAKQRMRRKRRR